MYLSTVDEISYVTYFVTDMQNGMLYYRFSYTTKSTKSTL